MNKCIIQFLYAYQLNSYNKYLYIYISIQINLNKLPMNNEYFKM